jgi:hypothetical protein
LQPNQTYILPSGRAVIYIKNATGKNSPMRLTSLKEWLKYQITSVATGGITIVLVMLKKQECISVNYVT